VLSCCALASGLVFPFIIILKAVEELVTQCWRPF
jgi:hypothetical protein